MKSKPFSHSRRSFIKSLALASPCLAGASHTSLAAELSSSTPKKAAPAEMAADLVIIGAGTGGCAAALAAARNGLRVIMTEETDWIGGQFTSQAVPPDENPWIETFGCTRSYQTLRGRIRDFYLRNFPLTAEARSQPYLNPGNGSVSRICHEPRAALAAFHELLAPYIGSSQVILLLRHGPLAALTSGDRVEAVTVRSFESGRDLVLRAPHFIDATECGDLLPLTKTEYVTGAESRKDTGEPHAPETANPANMQAFTCCFAMDYLPGENHTMSKPEEYDFWRDFVPALTPPWPGKLFSFVYSHPATLKPRNYGFSPEPAGGFFLYRRIIDRKNFRPGTYTGDISLVNWPQNDYLLGNFFDPTEPAATWTQPASAAHLKRAKQLSLSLLYWLQTEAPRPDGGTGYPSLRLRPDTVGTEDGLAKYPYIRESRRIQAELIVSELHVGTEARMKETGMDAANVTAAAFSDSVGIGSYRIDLHPSTAGDNYIDFSSLPFQIPLGALIPKRVQNLIPACKNLGVTHLTNGCYRLHPVEWNIGEAAGALAAFCLSKKRIPREIRAKPELLREFQNLLTSDGVPLSWPKVTPR